ncbi:hypothetical protein POM88_052935 [Heracleum sosnowskyi]|uniref:Uncharacterized protein n=1 Tax=Heracleum sosnowskyi TaxID=360622 RepID=A0AAD8GRK1_9APIA|nr:hypothetical protein POM88_052935 [Heracleum sosnowskyi]
MVSFILSSLSCKFPVYISNSALATKRWYYNSSSLSCIELMRRRSKLRRRSRRKKPQGKEKPSVDSAHYEALLKGGEQVTSVLEEIAKLLEDDNMDEASEERAVQLAAQGVIGKRVDEMESGFMMALDYMIQLAQNDQDDKRKALLEVIKETVLSHLTKKCPPHVQVIGLPL